MFRATPIFRSYKCTLQTIGVCILWKTELNIIKLCGAMCGGDCAFVVVWFFGLDLGDLYTPHYVHALHNLSFSFIITFTFNDHKTIVEIHYKFNNIFDV